MGEESSAERFRASSLWDGGLSSRRERSAVRPAGRRTQFSAGAFGQAAHRTEDSVPLRETSDRRLLRTGDSVFGGKASGGQPDATRTQFWARPFGRAAHRKEDSALGGKDSG